MRTITFYSYKGGTGRTLLAANMAVLGARLGQRVVLLDFDLEAPGLPYKFPPEERPRTPGVLDWLWVSTRDETPGSVEPFLTDLKLHEPFREGGWLKLMPAGRAPSREYSSRLRRLRLDEYLEQGRALNALVTLKERLEALGTDYLLIDARTGITSTNAVTTHVLADEVVVLALHTLEQMEGTREVLRSLQPLTSLATGDPIRLHVVLSRVPARPRDASRYTRTEDEEARVQRALDFLEEPTHPLDRTLDVGRVHLLHNDADLARGDFLTFREAGERSRSVIHVDYWRIATELYGAVAEDTAARLLEEAHSDPGRLETLGHYFASPEALTAAKGFRSTVRAPDEDEGEERGVGLEAQVEALRRRVETDSTARPDLAERLLQVGATLADLGRWSEALEAATEATTLYEQLAAEHPDAFLPHFAQALRDQAVYLAQVGRHEEALEASAKALDLYRALADERPDRLRPDLAMSLMNHAAALAEAGRHGEALEASGHAVDLYRALADERPDRFRPDLASSLHNHAIRLAEAGRHGEALEASGQALDLRRALAEERPDRFRPDLAMSLHNHAVRLAEAGRHGEALEASAQAVDLRRALADEWPDRFKARLASTLRQHAEHLAAVGRDDEARSVAQEALEIARALLRSE